MNLRQLESLVSVADHGTFSAAADVLGTVQSNVSTHISHLERELKVTLYDRATGRLTEEGQIVVARARRVAAELEALTADVVTHTRDVSGTVRVGMIGTTARWLAPQVLEVASSRHPGLRLVVMDGTSTTLEPRLASGQLDLAILNLPVSERDVVAEPLFEEDLVLVVSVADALSRRSEISLVELASMDLLLPMEGTAFRDELDQACALSGVRLRAKAELDGTRLIASLTFDGHGPAVLPATAVPGFLRADWHLVPIEGLPPRKVGVGQRSRALLSAPARALRSILFEVVHHGGALPQGLHLPVPAEPSMAGQ